MGKTDLIIAVSQAQDGVVAHHLPGYLPEKVAVVDGGILNGGILSSGALGGGILESGVGAEYSQSALEQYDCQGASGGCA